MESKENSQRSKISLYLRMVIGIYLIYLSYDLLDHFNVHTMFDEKMAAIFGFLYLLIGIGLCVWGGKGYFDSRKKDKNNEESL